LEGCGKTNRSRKEVVPKEKAKPLYTTSASNVLFFEF
jgi:hypothetical protein